MGVNHGGIIPENTSGKLSERLAIAGAKVRRPIRERTGALGFPKGKERACSACRAIRKITALFQKNAL